MSNPLQREPEVNKLFRCVIKQAGTGLCLEAGQPPTVLFGGEARPMEMRPLSAGDLTLLLNPIMDDERKRDLELGEARFVHQVGDGEWHFQVRVSIDRGLMRVEAGLT